MKTLPEHPDADALRKSLDAFDRRRTRKRALFVGVILSCAVSFALSMTFLADSAESRSLRLEIMTGGLAVILCVCGLAAAVVRVSLENTRRILKAIELLSQERAREGKQ